MVPLLQYVRRFDRADIVERAAVLPGLAAAGIMAGYAALAAWIPWTRERLLLEPTWALAAIAGWTVSSLAANHLTHRPGTRGYGLATHLVGSATLQWFLMSVIVDSSPWGVRFAFGCSLIFAMGSHGDGMRVTLNAPYHALFSLVFAAVSVARCGDKDVGAFLVIVHVMGLTAMFILGQQRAVADRVAEQLQNEREALAASLLAQTHSTAAQLERQIVEVMGAHHDARNLLATAQLKSELLFRKLTQGGNELSWKEVEETLLHVREGLKLASAVFQRGSRPSRDTDRFDLRPLLESELLAMRLSKPGIVLEASPGPDVALELPGGAVTLRRILLNVFLNAAEGDGRRGAHLVRMETRIAGQLLHIRISDDGPGFADDVSLTSLRRFTSKKDGSGLGLITVDSLVRASSGTLQLSNRPEGGAQVDVFLPVAAQAPSTEAPESAAQA